MNKHKGFTMNLVNHNNSIITLTFICLLSVILSACQSDNDSDALARAVFLESQRAKGTIIEEVTILGGQTRLKPGESHQLSASGIDSNGDQRDITNENEFIWSSSDTNIATVNSRGLVTAVASTTVNLGVVIIAGTTINDIYGEGEISVSDEKVNGIILKQKTPESGDIVTCIDASFNGDVSYEDGYLSLNTIKDMIFILNEGSTATISEKGILSTTNNEVENITIEATIDNIADQLTITADPSNLEAINAIIDGTASNLITMNVGERIQVSAQATIVADETAYNIDNNITWLAGGEETIGITDSGDNKGSLLALKSGTTQLMGNCGDKSSNTIIDIQGSTELNDIIINDGEATITLAKNQSVDLILTANYSTTPSRLNVSEFAAWNTFNNNLITTELVYTGTNAARYRITNTGSDIGAAIITVNYDNLVTRVDIIIE